MKRIWMLSLMIAGIVLIDQFSKGLVESHFQLGESLPVIGGFFNLTYVRNSGAAFGLGANAAEWIRKVLFLYLPLLICIQLVRFIWIFRHTKLLYSITYSLILAGAIGNLIDRFTLSYVVDFFDFYLGDAHYPTFNVADSCITIGVSLLVFDFIFLSKRSKSPPSVNSS